MVNGNPATRVDVVIVCGSAESVLEESSTVHTGALFHPELGCCGVEVAKVIVQDESPPVPSVTMPPLFEPVMVGFVPHAETETVEVG